MTNPALTLSDADLPAVRELAHRKGIDTEYWDFNGQHHEVSLQTLVTVLGAMDIHLSDRASVERALVALDEEPWRRVLPPCLVVRQGQEVQVPVHLPHGTQLRVEIEFENGGVQALEQLDIWVEPRFIDGQLVGRATFALPAGLPLGWHQVVAHLEVGGTHRSALAVTPDRLELPLADNERWWGTMVQLYSVPSARSWGMGDFADLADLARIMGQNGANFLLVNPLHACEPWVPITPSPYLPTSRRFLSALYIRPEAIAEYAYLPPAEAEEVRRAALRAKQSAGGDNASEQAQIIDRNQSWRHKREALGRIFQVPRSAARQGAFADFVARGGQALQDFALWCAIYEGQGSAPWPPDLQVIGTAEVERVRAEFKEQIEFHCWLQWVAREQLQQAQAAARGAGMRLGLMNDLAVGVNPAGADVWTAPQAFARNVAVGAPPDMYNQQGQNWAQPPLRPDYLAESAYQPLRQIIGTALESSGALRIDHIMGLFRLWWIPTGASPLEGTYVRYDHEAMVGVLLLEAHRAGAVVIGEDLGTVEPWVREYLAWRGVLGTSVLWFEKDGAGNFLPPASFRRLCLATVNTHDLPPTLGYLHGHHLEVQAELGILPLPLDQARQHLSAEIGQISARLEEMGMLQLEQAADEAQVEAELIAGLHRYIGQCPSALLGVSLVDMVGDKRMQNQPGTDNEYPNWRMPLADAQGRRLYVEDLVDNPQLGRLAQVMNEATR